MSLYRRTEPVDSEVRAEDLLSLTDLVCKKALREQLLEGEPEGAFGRVHDWNRLITPKQLWYIQWGCQTSRSG